MLTSAKLRRPWYKKEYFLKVHICVLKYQISSFYNHFHNILTHFDVSPQVKRCACKNGIFELSHELPNDLRPRMLVPTACSLLGGPLCPHKKKKY